MNIQYTNYNLRIVFQKNKYLMGNLHTTNLQLKFSLNDNYLVLLLLVVLNNLNILVYIKMFHLKAILFFEQLLDRYYHLLFQNTKHYHHCQSQLFWYFAIPHRKYSNIQNYILNLFKKSTDNSKIKNQFKINICIFIHQSQFQ